MAQWGHLHAGGVKVPLTVQAVGLGLPPGRPLAGVADHRRLASQRRYGSTQLLDGGG
jgi:hypothetical protein